MSKLILASQSPRRKELLGRLVKDFEIRPAKLDEVLDLEKGIDQAVIDLADQKGKELQAAFNEEWILSADTVVCFGDQVLGKPKDRTQAFNMLRMLSGNSHEVKTGVSLLGPGFCQRGVVTSKVFFRPLSDVQIEDYLNRNTYMDKAGSYGIQECDFVERIEGSYSNIVGLPLEFTQDLLKKAGLHTEENTDEFVD